MQNKEAGNLTVQSLCGSIAFLFSASCAQTEEYEFETSIDPSGCVLEHIAVEQGANHYQYDSLSPDGDLLAVAWDRGEERGAYLLNLYTGVRTNLPKLNNGVAIFTRNGATAREFAQSVNVVKVGINVTIPVPVAYHTFGGWKRSGFGDTNQHGPEGVKFRTKVKTITQRWPEDVQGSEFVIPTMG